MNKCEGCRHQYEPRHREIVVKADSIRDSLNNDLTRLSFKLWMNGDYRETGELYFPPDIAESFVRCLNGTDHMGKVYLHFHIEGAGVSR